MSDQAVNQVFEKVSFVNKISIILKATSDEDKPIPGYLYKDISNITYESEGYCESTVDYLVDRLDKQSCHVKLKALKLMKYVVENGHKNFRLGLIKHSAGITEATKFSGPLDPLHGNVPYLVIRKTAQMERNPIFVDFGPWPQEDKELSEILFDTEKSESSHRKPINTGQDGMGRTIGIHSKMEGFGSSQVQPKKTFSENLVENISKLAEKMTETPVDHQREILSSIQNVGGYRPPGGCHVNLPASTVELNNPDVQQRKVTPVRKHVPGKAGGGWDDEDEEEDIGIHQNSASHLSDRRSGNSEELSDRIEGLTVEDWTSEENLVMATVDSGQTLLLTLQQIKSFIKECSQINCEKIIELLNQRLSSDSDIQNMRSLLLLENLLMTDLVSMEFILSTCRDNLLWLIQNRKGAIYSKARKVVRIIEKLTNVMLLEINVPPQLQGQLIETNCENKDLVLPVLTDQSVSKVTMQETVPIDNSHSQSEDLLHGDNIEQYNVESRT